MADHQPAEEMLREVLTVFARMPSPHQMYNSAHVALVQESKEKIEAFLNKDKVKPKTIASKRAAVSTAHAEFQRRLDEQAKKRAEGRQRAAERQKKSK